MGSSSYGLVPAWFTLLSNLAGPVQHFSAAILDAWRNKVSVDLCDREGFEVVRCMMCMASLTLLLRRCHGRWCLEWVFLLGRVKGQPVPCRFCGAPDGDGHFFGNVPPLLLFR